MKVACSSRGRIDKQIIVDTLLPDEPGRFPWAGHLGIQMLRAGHRARSRAQSTTLVFTNTRSQAELWYQSLLEARPEWAGLIALHHGSLDKRGARMGRARAEGRAAEGGRRDVEPRPRGRLPAGRARLADRQPEGRRAAAAARRPQRPRAGASVARDAGADATRSNSSRRPPRAQPRWRGAGSKSRQAPERPLDVLVQHLVTIALGTGFAGRGTAGRGARHLELSRLCATRSWNWALDFVGRGGEALRAVSRVSPRRAGRRRWRLPRRGTRASAQRHRMSIGTIVSEATMLVKLMNGRNLGTIEEYVHQRGCARAIRSCSAAECWNWSACTR